MSHNDPATVPNAEREMANALLVLVLAPETRAWLTEHDPKALEQAERALELYLPGATALLEAADHRRQAQAEEAALAAYQREREAAGWAEGSDDPDSLNYRG